MELSDEQFAIADRIEAALEAAGPAGLTPSGAARATSTTTPEARTVLGYLVAHQLAHTTGNGAWTHYHAGR